MKIEEITHKVIGCAMQVHKTLGNGFQEVIYQRALAIELSLQKLLFVREKEMRSSIENKISVPGVLISLWKNA